MASDRAIKPEASKLPSPSSSMPQSALLLTFSDVNAPLVGYPGGVSIHGRGRGIQIYIQMSRPGRRFGLPGYPKRQGRLEVGVQGIERGFQRGMLIGTSRGIWRGISRDPEAR